jgi:DNA-binding transcriptional regulator YiaG
METCPFADIEIPKYTLDDLIGRRVDILSLENEDGKIVVARDVKTKEGFVLLLETKPEQADESLAPFGPESAKAKRLELGLTCREVARMAGMRPSHVSEFEQGEHVLTLAEGDRLRAVLEIQPNL